MDLLKRYIEQAARAAEAPVTDDSFDFQINETFCITTQVIEHDSQSITVLLDDRAMKIMEELDLLEDEEPAPDQTDPVARKPDVDLTVNPLADPSKPFGLANPKIIYVKDDPNTGEFAPVGKNPVAPSRFTFWSNEQYHARNKGYMLKYIGNNPEMAEKAKDEGETPKTGRNLSGEELSDRGLSPAMRAGNEISPLAEMNQLRRLAGMKEVIMKPGDEDDMEHQIAQHLGNLRADDAVEKFKKGMGDPKKGEILKPEKEKTNEAEYHGHSVQLGKPSSGDVKKYKVFVKDPKSGNIKKVNFGDPNMEIKRDNPERRKNFRARHNCADKKDRTKAGYWSCRMWSSKPVSKVLKGK
jgi:hypothetical protein